MKVAIGSDHAGFELKQHLGNKLKELGHQIIDVGTTNLDSVDYPDYAEKLGLELIEKRAQRGLLICGSGVGASIAANKMPGIRAGLCHDTYSAHQGVEHDDMNVLVVGGRIIGTLLAEEILGSFLDATFTGEERHQRRLNKVLDIEKRY